MGSRWPAFIGCILLAVLAAAASEGEEGRVMFEDSFEGEALKDGWTWLRENPRTWRLKDGALEIRVEPGFAETVKNALVRDVPDRTKGTYAYDVTVTNTTKPTKQWEQAGLTWYHDGKPVFKLVKEFVDGKLCIVPSMTPMDAQTVQLRLIVSGDDYVAQYRPDAKGEFTTAARGKLPPAGGGKDQISIQSYHGPEDAEHWIRFDDFRIVEVRGLPQE